MAEENKKAMEIIIDDGSLWVPIKNKQGEEIGVFKFRPTDIAIIKRFNDISKKFPDIVEPLNDVNINEDGTADIDDMQAMEVLEKAEKQIYEACDYLFGGNMSEAFFGKMNPFSPINGSFYCELAFNAVGQFITQQFSKETQKINKNLTKYTDKYRREKK